MARVLAAGIVGGILAWAAIFVGFLDVLTPLPHTVTCVQQSERPGADQLGIVAWVCR